MAATAEERKAFLLEARVRGASAVEAVEALKDAPHSLLGPITELGFSRSKQSEVSRDSISENQAGRMSMRGVVPGSAGKGGRLAPGAPAPRPQAAASPAAATAATAASRSNGASKRKSAPPQRLPGTSKSQTGKRRRSEDETTARLERELATSEERATALESAVEAEKTARAEAERTAASLRSDLEHERSSGAGERRALASAVSRLRSALEATLRDVATHEAREKRRDLSAQTFELGRAVYRSASGFGSGRDAWEDGDADRRLRVQAAELLARREALERARSAPDDTGPAIEKLARREAHESNSASLRRDESELAAQRAALDRRKLRHVREWTRVRNEDASRFRSRPLMHERYLLLSLLGKGGFSEVWLAYDLEAATKVAVKMHQLDQAWSDDKKRAYVRHAAREYSIMRDLDHPRVVKLHDVFEVDDDTFATVLEYCSGDDLDAVLRARNTLPEPEAKAIVLQVLAGLHHLHSPAGDGPNRRAAIIHYDLKPGNILFDAKGDAKITDFGLAKIIPSHQDSLATSLELTSQGAGTYWYLPPECFQSAHDRPGGPPRIHSNVDVWSVGVIFYQMLYGARPFGEGQSQQRILSERTMLRATNVSFPDNPDVSDQAKDFIRLCLRPSQADRPGVKLLCDHAYLAA